MAPLPVSFLTHGSPDPLPRILALQAGPLELHLESGDVRSVRLGDREVIRRIHGAVRDHNWGTVPGGVGWLEMDIEPTRFRVQYVCDHRSGDIHFVWKALIEGGDKGTLRFVFDGEAKTTFLRNRIGLCVLHPIRECAGAACRTTHAGGATHELRFPDAIAREQPIEGLSDLTGLAHEVEAGVWAELDFEGDLFETEDQRNWIDASFKTFSTPLRLPFPVEVRAGTRIHQEVRLRISGLSSLSRPKTRNPETTLLPTHEVRPLPTLGLGTGDGPEERGDRDIARLTALCPAHLRVDVRASETGSIERLECLCSTATRLGAGIELVIHLDMGGSQDSINGFLESLRKRMMSLSCRVDRILILGAPQDKSTPGGHLETARRVLAGLGAPIGAGTAADLYQLSLVPPPSTADFIAWSMNPQVHADDNTSIAETPEAAAQQVGSVRGRFPGKPLVISPVTLKPRFNPVATGPERAPSAGTLPASVDPRQMSLFGAGWTLAMIQALAESGADSVTFFETVGWRGVMEASAGCPEPELFPSIPGAVFPLYHVLADVQEFRGGEVHVLRQEGRQKIGSLLMTSGGRRRLMLANLTPETVRLDLTGLGTPLRHRVLDASSVLDAMTAPEVFRSSWRPGPWTALELEGHSLMTLDLKP